jgi:pimeloyl-ACP methyl ester carboxylesterase
MRRVIRRRKVLAAIALIAIAGVLLSNPRRLQRRAAREMTRAWLLVTGRLIDVGDYRLHVERYGQGTPPIVLEAGLCQRLESWGALPAELAEYSEVIAYDRSRLGFSGTGPPPRSSSRSVEDLRALLTNAGIEGPYILVGHSFGGLNVRLFASRYPDAVAGIVLIDASHEDQYSRFAALMPPEEREKYLRNEGGANCERVDLIASGKEIATAGALPPVPFVVLSADPATSKEMWTPDRAATHMELQRRLAGLIQNGRHIVVEHSDHFIHLDRPDVVTDAIRSVVQAARGTSSRRD